MTNIKIFFSSFVVLVFIIIANVYYQQRGVLVITYIINIFLLIKFFSFKKLIETGIIIFIIPICFITLYNYLYVDNFSIFQLLRGQIYLLLSLIIIFFLKDIKFDLTLKNDFFRIFLVFCEFYVYQIFLIFLIDFVFSTNFSPLIGPSIDSNYRIIYPFFKAIILLMPIFLYFKKYFLIIIISFLTIITYTKGFYFTYLYSLILTIYLNSNKKYKFYISSKSIFLCFCFFIFSIIYAYIYKYDFFIDRTYNLFNFFESSRFLQMQDAFYFYKSNLFNMFFGYGFAIPYRDLLSIDTSLIITNYGLYKALVNLSYDLEIFYMNFLLRFGIYGFLIFLILIFKNYKNEKKFIFSYLILSGLGSGFLGINVFIEMFIFAFVIEYIKKIRIA